jgi:hypothetical protein
MAMRGNGLTEKSSQDKPVLGYSDTETVKLDFDDSPYKIVKYWAERALNWFKLGGYIILKSSKNSYHVLFNKSVSWAQNMSIVAWVALQCRNRGLVKWFIMQAIKKSSTLRVSKKKDKPSPRIVYRHGEQDEQIQGFLEYRRFIKSILKKLSQNIRR